VWKPAPERDRDARNWLAETMGQEVSDNGHLGDIQLACPDHRAKRVWKGIVVFELELYSIGGDAAVPERRDVLMLSKRDAERQFLNHLHVLPMLFRYKEHRSLVDIIAVSLLWSMPIDDVSTQSCRPSIRSIMPL
jgi:hypothetical protein